MHLRVSTFDGRLLSLHLGSKPCPIYLHRMVESTVGVVSIPHKKGVEILRVADIRSVSFEDISGGAPWDYDDPLN